jgi:hypothetical protein
MKGHRLPPGPWCWTSLELVESDAWRSRSINTVRFIDFLLRENMRNAGAENGLLKAPYEQLEAWGIGAQYVSSAIEEAEQLGLVDCHKPGRRMLSTFALTWLWLHDGSPPSDRWKHYRNPKLKPPPRPKSRNLPSEGKVKLPSEGRVDGSNLPPKGKVDGFKNLPYEGKDLSRSSYQDRGYITDVSTAEAARPTARRATVMPAATLNGSGHLPAGKAHVAAGTVASSVASPGRLQKI